MDAACKGFQTRLDHLKDQNNNEDDSGRSLASPTDLVNDTTTIAQTLDLTSLQTSKHHADFRIRNQHRVLKLATILSDLQLHLSAAQRSQNQSVFDDLCARITKAGEGLASLAQSMPANKADCAARKLNGGELSEVCKSMKDSEWYHIQHGSVAGEGEKHDSLSLGRIRLAREAYEADLNTEGSEVEIDSV
ncbi:hypothetical protein MBLNU13_g02076t1 [Cladosporium sp. NU13]